MIKFIATWWAKKVKVMNMSADERYLSNSVDLADLERRQRMLEFFAKDRSSSHMGL
tara:strand:+ start:3687 stop:3854 length:168 start_codon:yes stop_codon:yes gene_type:complete